MSGGRNFIIIIDDCSRNLWLFVLKNEAQVISKLVGWYNEVETSAKKKVKILRYFLVIHRKIGSWKGLIYMTMLERIRCLLLIVGISKRFSGEIVDNSSYLINRCHSVARYFKTLKKLWNNKTPDLSHLKVFYCKTLLTIRGMH